VKERLDVLLVEQGIVTGRDKAKAVIMAGLVYVDGEKITKGGTCVERDAKIEYRGEQMKFVSRGGYKLERAMRMFPITLDGCICMDIGASTGGFSDCMLQCGAKKVYAVDVGYGQLDWKLRTDERVVNMERTNIRYVEEIEDVLDFVSVDVSFISLKLVLPVAFRLLGEQGSGVCLIKPQFEAGRSQVGKGGVVRDKTVHLQVIEQVMGYARDNGFSIGGLDYSPIKGPKGNIEYLLYITKGIEGAWDVEKTVETAHRVLNADDGEVMV